MVPAPSGQPVPPDQPQAAEPTIERRIVTVLFADLVGFTSLSERLDAEDVASVQDAYFATVRDTITRYGGALEKFIGDAAMAAFGIPLARDDDALRAVRAWPWTIGHLGQRRGRRRRLRSTANCRQRRRGGFALSLPEDADQAAQAVLFEPGTLHGLHADLPPPFHDLGVLDGGADQPRQDDQVGQQCLLDRLHRSTVRRRRRTSEGVPPT